MPFVRRLHTSTLLRLLLVVTMTATLLATVASSALAAPVTRVAGSDRIQTAVEVATTGWDRADEVLVATAHDFADAVAAAALASSKDAPLLLTNKNDVPDAVIDTLNSLDTKRVTILGGPGVVADSVQDELRDNGFIATRIAGDNRFDTAARIAHTVSTGRDVPVVALALGKRTDGKDAFPDALAAASLAGFDAPVPTVLTMTSDLPAETENALRLIGPDRVVVLGGPAAISDKVMAQVESLGIDTARFAESNRYGTAVNVAKAASTGANGGTLDANEAIFVAGEDFPDALSAGALAARRSAPLLLVPHDILDDQVDAYIRGDATSFAKGTVVGGKRAVSSFVEKELNAAINGEPRPEPVQAAGTARDACDPAYSSPDCAYTYEHPVSMWERLAQCESGGNWAINTGNGYYGGIQFSLKSWQWVGGQGYPHQNSKWEQIHRGELLHDRQGWGAWPACTSSFGWR